MKIMQLFLSLLLPCVVPVMESVDICSIVKDHEKAVSAIAFAKNGRSIFTGSADGTICKRDLINGQTHTVAGLGEVSHLKRVGPVIAVVSTVCRCPEKPANHFHPEFYYPENLAYKSSGIVSHNGGHAASITDMKKIDKHSMVTGDRTGRLVYLYDTMQSKVQDLTLPVSRLATTLERTFAMCPEEKPQVFMVMNDLRMNVCGSFAVPENSYGKMTAIASLKQQCVVLGFDTGKIIVRTGILSPEIKTAVRAHNAPVVEVEKINKHHFVSAAQDGSLKVWKSKSGRQYRQLNRNDNNAGAIKSLAAYWDKQKKEATIAAGYEDGSTCTWKLGTGK